MAVMVISGGSSGIGQATAVKFALQGWKVYEVSRSGASCDGVVHLQGDVTRTEDCQHAVEEVLRQERGIDVLICNAGMGVSGSVEFCDEAEMHRQMEVNFFGTVNLIRAALPSMREQHHGRILIVSSVASVFSIPFQGFYSASKAAVNALASALRNEVAPHGIKVGLLLPGDVKSGFTAARNKCLSGAEAYPLMQRAVATMEEDEAHGHSVEHVAACLYALARRRYLPLYNYEGLGYHCLVVLARLLPATFVNWAVGKLY